MSETVEIDLKDFNRVILKKFWLVALCAIILAASVLVYTVNFVTPTYRASVSIYVNNNSGADDSYISSADLAVALRLVATYVNIVQSDTVLDKVIEDKGLMITAAQLRSMITAEAIGETEMFEVTVTTPNPQLSADIANAIAKVAPTEIAHIIDGSTAKVIDYAKVPTRQASPNYMMNALIGGAIGAVLVVLVLFLQYMMDTRVKNEEDLTRICPIPVLGVIPQLSSGSKKAGTMTRR
jgi:capsular polysaccharide biosynthesis protein